MSTSQLSLFAPSPAARSYHVRRPLKGSATDAVREIAKGKERAEKQDTRILWLFREGRTVLTPSDAAREYIFTFGEPILLTSARRALSNLTKQGLLKVSDKERRWNDVTKGYEHFWELNA